MFEYKLPEEQIAQRPISGERSDAKLLVLSKKNGILDRHVRDLPELLERGDLLVLNNSRVVACRFFPDDKSEIFLAESLSDGRYRILARPLKRFSTGKRVQLSKSITATIETVDSQKGEAVAKLESERELSSAIEEEGFIPIPPYIRGGHSDDSDKKTYQTVFAEEKGSIAAPTAALHFTTSLFDALKVRGVEVCFLTLHVGLQSILPVERQLSSGGVIPEQFQLSEVTFNAIRKAKSEGRRIVGVGTTVTRALESLSRADWEGSYDFHLRSTDLFIKPGFNFQILDLLMTNFHQSGSTHLSLVSAFAGEEHIWSAYTHAIENNYRFLSYGDSMLLEKASK